MKLKRKEREVSDAKQRKEQDSIGPSSAGGLAPQGLDVHERIIESVASKKLSLAQRPIQSGPRYRVRNTKSRQPLGRTVHLTRAMAMGKYACGAPPGMPCSAVQCPRLSHVSSLDQ
jgi:hypothetical protein